MLLTDYPFGMLCFFTIQSNIAVLALIIYLLVTDKREISHNVLVIKLSVTVWIMLTFTVYGVLLAKYLPSGTISLPDYVGNFFVHMFTPVLMLLDFLLFDRTGKIRLRDGLWSFTLPFAYLVFVWIYSSLGGLFHYGGSTSHVPYFFMNISGVGITAYITYIAGIFIALLTIIFGLGFLHNLLQPKKKEALS